MSIKLTGKIKLNNQKAQINTFMSIDNQNIALDFNYINGQWIFSLDYVNSEIFNQINSGKTIQIQLARRTVTNNKNRLSYSENYTSNAGLRVGRYTLPNYLAVGSPGDSGIPEDKKARINITNEVRKGVKSINLTTWVNNMIKYESPFTGRKQATFYSPFYNDWISGLVYWFAKFKFVLLINNVRYAFTNKEMVIQYYHINNIANLNMNVSSSPSVITVEYND